MKIGRTNVGNTLYVRIGKLTVFWVDYKRKSFTRALGYTVIQYGRLRIVHGPKHRRKR